MAAKPITLVGELSLADLQAIAAGVEHKALSDMDFFETLAARRCILVPPWVLRLRGDGGVERVAMMTYDVDLNLDKPRTLLATMRALRQAQAPERGWTPPARARHDWSEAQRPRRGR